MFRPRRGNIIPVSLEGQSKPERKKAVWCGRFCRVVVRREQRPSRPHADQIEKEEHELSSGLNHDGTTLGKLLTD